MSTKSTTNQLNQPVQVFTSAVIRYYLLPVLLFLLPMAGLVLSAPSARFSGSLADSRQQASLSWGDGDLLKQAHYSYHLPIRSEQVEGELEMPEEEEDPHPLLPHRILAANGQPTAERFYGILIRQRLSQVNASFLKREPIPLFILQHSWKGFLS